jgi:hypothetical protein
MPFEKGETRLNDSTEGAALVGSARDQRHRIPPERGADIGEMAAHGAIRQVDSLRILEALLRLGRAWKET